MRYWDTSLLMSLLVPDSHTARAVAEAREDGGRLSSCAWSAVEVKSALAKEVRVGNLDTTQALAAWAQFESWLAPGGGLHVYGASQGSFLAAAETILIQPGRVRNLRAGDAIHIAVAKGNAASGFLTADRNQAAAASELGLAVTLVEAS